MGQYSTLDFNPVPTARIAITPTRRTRATCTSPSSRRYVPIAAARLLFYSVWRLDGATPAIAMGLVDKATQTMNNASGAACIDRNRGDLNFVLDAGYGAGDWDLHQAGVFLGQAGFAVNRGSNYDEFGSGHGAGQMPSTGDPLAFYSGGTASTTTTARASSTGRRAQLISPRQPFGSRPARRDKLVGQRPIERNQP